MHFEEKKQSFVTSIHIKKIKNKKIAMWYNHILHLQKKVAYKIF